jgi:copper oxidase (laccase) domain-containing protein
MLDLWGLNEHLLVMAGLSPGRIHTARRCTACEPDLFYSHRGGSRGRLVTLAAL